MTDRRNFIDQMSAIWYRAESEADPKAWEGISLSDCIEVARDRVMRVYEGEVRWSEASAGERAIWKGRPRWPDDWKRANDRVLHDDLGRDPVSTLPPGVSSWSRRPGGPRLHNYRERHWWNVYDTVEFWGDGKITVTATAFYGSYNFPDVSASNMSQVCDGAGVMSRDHSFVVMHLYVVPCINAAVVPWWAVTGVFLTGNKPRTPELPLDELWLGIAAWNRPIVIPSRQSFAMVFRCPFEIEPFKCVVHMEGLLTRDVQ